jgi:integrase/recombinase XerC
VTDAELMPNYAARERTCPICGTPLPAHQTWPGARYRFCSASECAAKVKKLPRGRYIRPNEHKCEGDACSNFVPEGRYSIIPAYLSCCAACWYRRRERGNIRVKCDCACDREFFRSAARIKRANTGGLLFFSPQHQGHYIRNKYLADRCGVFREIVDEYLCGFASFRYRDLGHVRTVLGPLCLFLSEQKITSLEDVTPKIVSQFLTWAENYSRKAAQEISCISVFFQWMIAEGHREAANPVITSIHLQRKKHRLPRPLEAQELDSVWQLLGERGNARLRFAAAAAEEAGLRIGEICSLRVADVDPIRQRLFVRLPNKGNRERWAFFSERTKRYYIEWMAERNPTCSHDYVLHNIIRTR